MKAVVLAGGRGNRLGDLTRAVNKCMLPLKGKPVLEYNLRRAAEIPEVNEIILVVGYRAEDIINHYGNRYERVLPELPHPKDYAIPVPIKYVIQREQRGLVHAIECAKETIGDDDIFLLLGDEVLANSRHASMIKEFIQGEAFGICGVIFRKDNLNEISKTYTVSTDAHGTILRLIEKPKRPLGPLQGTGHCVFRNEILDYLDRTPIHPERGERELPDLIQCAIDDGKTVKPFELADDYTNINSEENLKEAEKLELG